MMAYSKLFKVVAPLTMGAAVLAGAGEAKAAGDGWGLHSGETMSKGSLMPFGEFGWPDVTLGVAYGITDKIDIGGRLGFVYGPFHNPGLIAFGMALSVPIRFSLVKGGGVSALIHVDPGLKFPAFSPVGFGIQFPVGAEVGIHVADHATLQVGLDLPMHVNFVNGAYFNIVPMAGPGFEYHIGGLAIGLNTRFGASVIAGGGTAGAGFGFLTQAYVGYKI